MASSHRYQRLVQAVQELSLARSVQQVMEIVRVVARELTGADGATFILRDGNKCFYADENAISPLWKGNRFPMENCISGWVMLNKEAVVIKDIYEDNRIPHDAYRPTFVKSLAVVPIRTLDPIGAIGNYWASHYTPTEEELNLLASLADTTALALENVQVYQELEQRVKDRTQELLAANEQLAAQNEELETITYSLSHDLRAPLRHINLFAESIKDNLGENIESENEMLLAKIDSKIDGMQSLITDLLRMFQMGRQELIVSKVNMKDLVTDIYEELIEAEQNRAIRFDVRQDLPEAYADKTLIKQAWVNLILNAIKYTRERTEAQIKIGFKTVEDAIIYSIEDNGTGFDMSHYDKVFQPFQRLHSTSQFEGSGIGLAIVDRIVKRHNGSLWAKAEIDKGAAFYISIPAVDAPIQRKVEVAIQRSEVH